MANTRTSTSTPGDSVGTDAPAAVGSTEPGTGTVVPNNADDVNAPLVDKAPEPDFTEISGVKYVGPYDVRVLSVDDLRKMGVNSPQADLRWDSTNGKIVPKTSMNDETVTALKASSEFQVV